MFYAFSSNIISQSIETFGDSLEENLQIWLSTLGPFAEFFYILTGNTMLIGVGIALLAIIILLGLILSAYLIGYRHFIKANLIFGSIFIVLSGILITVMSIIFRDQLNIGADLASFGWILLALGIVIAVIALGGTACGFVPNKCFVGLNFYVILLLVLMGVLVVFGLVILVFPGLFWETMVEALSEDCESTSEKGYAETCQEQMKLYFNLMCNTTQEQIDKYKGQFAVKGECSYADIKDRIVNNLIQGILSNLNLIAFASILISVIFLYVVIIVLVALNSNWEGTGAMRVDLTTAKQKVHRD
ncbi:hypothetical protein BLNAU_1673 [Blattamonas nauphoetae]|uniref:Tetraspanin family protein n=1 Tax=Blattamonas nauphoetae TaxID=2049346 RepID=A0ABQ9YHL5_9EUKA|nr:hypothetical protein BLNAU_1673 [Blattamonas nauphoetae]